MSCNDWTNSVNFIKRESSLSNPAGPICSGVSTSGEEFDHSLAGSAQTVTLEPIRTKEFFVWCD